MKPVKVSQINNYVKRILQSDPLLGNTAVIGEISNLKYHGSGHTYFSLKDETSKLNCFLPAEVQRNLHYQLADGMEIVASGYIYVYERGGTYSLNVRDITVEGTGNLSIAFEKLKEKLSKEGLFEEKYKKPLPEFPKKVGIVTSDTGAAVRDIIKVIKSRSRTVDVLLFPCLVQGPDAARDISFAIDEMNEKFPDLDVLIVGRGGGSMEELWPFNEEVVARSIFLSRIPVISAVGHETDFTIADFTADKRAATPTEAAQMAVPDQMAVIRQVDTLRESLVRYMSNRIMQVEQPLNRYGKETLLDMITVRIAQEERKIAGDFEYLYYFMKQKAAEAEHRLQNAKVKLDSANPYDVMGRGFGIITDKDGKIVSEAGAFAKGDALTVILKDGKVNCEVNDVLLSQEESS